MRFASPGDGVGSRELSISAFISGMVEGLFAAWGKMAILATEVLHERLACIQQHSRWHTGGPSLGAVMLKRFHSAATEVPTCSPDYFWLGWEPDAPAFEMPNKQNQIPVFKGFVPGTKWNWAQVWHGSLFWAQFQSNCTVEFYKNFQTLGHFSDLNLNLPKPCSFHSSLIKIKAHFKKWIKDRIHSMIQSLVATWIDQPSH